MVRGGTPSGSGWWGGVPLAWMVGGYPRSGWGGTPGLDGGGVPQVWMVGGYPRSGWWGGGYTMSGWWGGTWGTPSGQVWMVGGVPWPGLDGGRGGTPGLDGGVPRVTPPDH